MKVHVCQHAPFEGLGSIEAWLEGRGMAVGYTRLFAGDPLPAVDAIDMLIAMGGPMSVNDEADLPWLKAEKQLVRDAVTKGLPVLGVCLGAQLIANALGARVYRHAVKEIGWFPVQAVAVPAAETFRFPLETLVFHWHGETFDLPPGAVRLARSEGCENQAFQIGARVLALQFHLETTPETARSMVEHCCSEMVPGPYVQPAEDLRSAPRAYYHRINALMDDVLRYLTAER